MHAKKTWRKNLRLSGFTLAELVIVITILAVLATVGFLALSWYSQDARESSARANSRSVQTAIVSESVTTGNSPRYYVVHDSAAALSWATMYVDGTPVILTGWSWDQAGTNYSAGNPDYVKLKLNPEKFRTSSAVIPAFPGAFAYDTTKMAVGAVDFVRKSGGKNRQDSWFQVVAIPPTWGTVKISGTYPVWISGSVAGLVRDPAGTPSDPLVEWFQTGTPTGCGSWTTNGYSVSALAHGASSTVTKTVLSGTGLTIWTRSATATCSIGAVSVTENSVSCIAGYVEGPGLTCIADVCGGTIADANGHSTALLQTVAQNWTRSATAGTCTWDCNTGFGWDPATSSCKASIPGVCGTANKTYAYSSSSFGSDTFCSAGTATPVSPAFPSSGSTTTWSCSGQWNGAPASCSALQALPAGCAASTQTVNGRSYSVPAINHGAATSANSSTVVLGGSQAYSQTFSCSNGIVSTSGGETAGTLTCSANFTLNSVQCIAKSCLILKNAGVTTSGNYSIDPDSNASTAALSAYCDMTTDGGGYTYYPITSGLATSKYTDNDSCKAVGLNMVIPRTKAHWLSMVARYDTSYFAAIPGIYNTVSSTSYTTCVMRDPVAYGSGCSGWRALDGGKWWIRDSTFSEPNGDYTAGWWLGGYTVDSTTINAGQGFNDVTSGYSTSKYVCSTNDKP